MSKYEQIKDLKDEEFRRLTGVKKATFVRMVKVYETSLNKLKKLSGRPSVLSLADHVLMMLEYNREYRSYFHIAQSYGLHEANAYRCIKRVEELLLRSGEFSLPGRKALQDEAAMNEKVIVVDATETEVERPKKTAAVLFRQKEAPSPQNASGDRPANGEDFLHSVCQRSAA